MLNILTNPAAWLAFIFVLGWVIRADQLEEAREFERRVFDGPVMSDNGIIVAALGWPVAFCRWVWVKRRRIPECVFALAGFLAWFAVVYLWNTWG